MRRLVIVESPAGDRVRNVRYLHACLLDCLERGETPFARHGFFPYFLCEDDHADRELGISCGFDIAHAFAACARSMVVQVLGPGDGDDYENLVEAEMPVYVGHAVYTDLGISPGMQRAVETFSGVLPREDRQLGSDWASKLPPEDVSQLTENQLLAEIRQAVRHNGSNATLGAALRKLVNIE